MFFLICGEIGKVLSQQLEFKIIAFVSTASTAQIIFCDLWKPLRIWVTNEDHYFIQKFYEENKITVRIDGDKSSWFRVIIEVKSSSYLYPIATAVWNDERLSVKNHRSSAGGIALTGDAQRCDLDFTDDIAFIHPTSV